MTYSLIQLIIISLSLALDAFSVSVVGGINSKTARIKHALKVAFFFGSFQAFMPAIGWLLAEILENFISSYGHFIAFILLSVIGLKMIKESLEEESPDKTKIYQTKTLILLSFATSIDALVVGITLDYLSLPFFLSITVIGVVTFILSFMGFLFGKKIGTFFGKRLEIIGGLVLILIGLKILLENL